MVDTGKGDLGNTVFNVFSENTSRNRNFPRLKTLVTWPAVGVVEVART